MKTLQVECEDCGSKLDFSISDDFGLAVIKVEFCNQCYAERLKEEVDSCVTAELRSRINAAHDKLSALKKQSQELIEVFAIYD